MQDHVSTVPCTKTTNLPTISENRLREQSLFTGGYCNFCLGNGAILVTLWECHMEPHPL